MREHAFQLIKPWKGEVRKATTAGLMAGMAWLLAHIGFDTNITVAELIQVLGASLVAYFVTWLNPNK